MTDSSTAAPRYPLRFSLRRLIAVVLILASGVSLVLLKREVDELRARNQELNAELGRVSVNDPNKIHVLALNRPQGPDWQWQWRIYLPKNRQYFICAALKDIPVDGLAPVTTYMVLEGSEYPLSARLQQKEGSWEIVINTDNQSVSEKFDSPEPDFLSKKAYVDEVITGSKSSHAFGGMHVADAEKPVVLLRVRQRAGFVGPTSSRTTPIATPCPGVLIWISDKEPQ
jgi:hypothetical protein